MAPTLHLVGLRQHRKRSSPLHDTRNLKGGKAESVAAVGEENMTCLTNLADPGACQWRPAAPSRQWMKEEPQRRNSCDFVTQDSNYDLQELYCAVAQQLELSSQNDQQSDCSDESKSWDTEDFSLNGSESNLYGLDKSRTLHASQRIPTATFAPTESIALAKRQSSRGGCQEILNCNQRDLKPTSEKNGWKNPGRHAEDRRKRWAQADPLLDFWKCVSTSKHAAPFRRPVALLEDYDLIIRQPMDLSTIRRQLENDESYCLESLRRDLMLMVTNALVYNKKGTDFYKMAMKLKSHLMKLFERHQRETHYSNTRASPIGSSTVPAVKFSKSKQSMQPSKDSSSPTAAAENLPLAPVKKHRTMRRPRSCIANDANDLRSDVANGAAAMDSSSEEEAAAVLICFSNEKSRGDKQTLSVSNSAKPEYLRKKMKRIEAAETDNNSACSVSQVNDSHLQYSDQFMAFSDASVASADHSPANSSPGTDTRYLTKERDKCWGLPVTGSSQAKRCKAVGHPQSNEALKSSVATRVAGTDEASSGTGRSERQCLGLKHKWQERWRRQSAVGPDYSGSSHQHHESVATQCGSQTCGIVDGGSIAEVSHQTFPQLLH